MSRSKVPYADFIRFSVRAYEDGMKTSTVKLLAGRYKVDQTNSLLEYSSCRYERE